MRRHGNARAKTGQRAGASAGGFRRGPGHHEAAGEQQAQHDEHRMQRRRRQHHQRRAAQGAHRKADERRDAVDGGAVLTVDVEHRRADGRRGKTRRDTLDQSGHHQPCGAIGQQERQQRQHFQSDGQGDHGTPAQVIGQASGKQQREQQGKGIHGKDRREQGRAEMPLGLVQPIQRRRRSRCRKEGDQCGRMDRERPARSRYGRGAHGDSQ